MRYICEQHHSFILPSGQIYSTDLPIIIFTIKTVETAVLDGRVLPCQGTDLF